MAAKTFDILPQEVHIWQINLAHYVHDTKRFRKILTPDEMTRADRFHFDIHRQRFTVTRALLRCLLNAYLASHDPRALTLNYSSKGKPFLADTNLRFNVSHSHDLAVIGFTLSSAIGVDIEKMDEHYNNDVALRYFSPSEVAALNETPVIDRAKNFFTLWARKEAVIKALGDGLSYALPSFSVSIQQSHETLIIRNKAWYLENISVDADYACAFATDQNVTAVRRFEWTEDLLPI